MKKFFSKFFVFGLFAFVFYASALYVWGTYAPPEAKPNLNYRLGSKGHLHTRLKEVKETSNVDLLFLGSSRAYRSFDPRIFSAYGYSSFNLGSSAQTPIQTEVLLNRYLDGLNPKRVIYEVFPGTFYMDGIESSVDLIANDRNDLHSLQMAMELQHMKTYNTFLYASMRDLFGLNKYYEESAKKMDDLYVVGGYIESGKKDFVQNPFQEKQAIYDAQQFDTFRHILNKLEQRNIEVTLVYVPVSQGHFKRYQWIDKFDSTMAALAPYYNFNNIMELKDTVHFFDSYHLNQKGVEALNEKMIEVLNLDGGSLRGHRSQEGPADGAD